MGASVRQIMSPVGFEPTTLRLKGVCSTPELRALKRRVYNNSSCLVKDALGGVVPFLVPTQRQNRGSGGLRGFENRHLAVDPCD